MPVTDRFSAVSASQASTTSATAIASSVIDAGNYSGVSYTIKVATNSVDWEVFGANTSDFSDEVSVQASATVAAGAHSSFSDDAVWRYYRVKIVDTASGTHGTATVAGRARF